MLSKNADKPLEPLEYRLLLITPVLYRAWAKLRLRHLRPWITGWALPNMFGGVQGVGAAEAWYTTALDIEHALTHSVPLVGGALDLFKCFDQILRPLLYEILRISGLPEPILTAYANYQEQMLMYNSLNGAIGIPHKHPAGIPQGCPFSMIFVGLLLRPWMIKWNKWVELHGHWRTTYLSSSAGTGSYIDLHTSFISQWFICAT